MSDQITPAPRAQDSVATPKPPTPPPAATAAPPQSYLTRPTTANGPVPTAVPSAPGPAGPSTTTSHALAPTTEEPLNLNATLNHADRYWKFKAALQAAAITTGLIGIGTIGWCVSTTPLNDTLTYGYDEYWTLWPGLITFSVSIIWCVACILGLIVRKRPVHPGLRVALDLLLWLSFLVTALFAMVSLTELLQWGEYGDLSGSYSGYSSSYGDYELQSNGTWVWESTRDSDSTSSGRSCDRTSSYYGYGFKDCAEQDAYVNKLWQEKPHRQSVELTGVVCQFFGLVLHFALFVWACIDCHRYNRSKISKDAEKMAASIVQTMITNGAVIPPPGQAHMRHGAPWGQQQMGYYQLPQQGQAYPMMAMHPQGQSMPQQYNAPPGHAGPFATGAAGSSNEKGAGPRYA
jgi:hypothetical protein